MTVFEQELRKLFEKNTIFSDIRFVGNACYGRLNDDVRVKIHFAAGGAANEYDRLKVTLLNRKEGEIDSLVLRLRDIWGIKQTNNPNFQEGISPHLWYDYEEVGWYVYKPTITEYNQLAEAVKTYVEVFQEPEPQQKWESQMSQSMG